MLFPVLAENSVSVSGYVGDVNSNNLPDLVFTALNGFGQPEEGIRIDITPEGAPGPLFSGSTDLHGSFTVADVPPDNYTWISSNGQIGWLYVNASQFPLTVSEEEAFWLWYMAFKSDAPSGQKGRSLLSELAKYTGYNLENNPLPSEAKSDYEASLSLMTWVQSFDQYIEKEVRPNRPTTYELVKPSVYIIKSSLDLISKFKEAPQIQLEIEEYIITSGEGEIYGSIITFEFHRLLDIRGLSLSAIGIFLAVLDFSVLKPNVVAHMKPDELEEHWFEINLDIYRDFLVISMNIFQIAKIAFSKLGYVGLSKTATAFVSGLGAVIGIITMWLAILDYQSKYPDSPFWQHLNDWEVWKDMLLVIGGGLIALGSIITFLSAIGALEAAGIGSAITGVGIVITIAAAIIALGLWIYNWWQYNQQIQTLTAQLSGALTNMYRVRQSLNAINTPQLRDLAALSLSFSNYALKYALEASGTYKMDFEMAHDYLIKLSDAQQKLRNAVLDAREALDNLISLYLYYESPNDPNKKIISHLVGVNCTKADYISPTKSFEVNASIFYASGRYYDAKYVTYNNLDGNSYCMDHSTFARLERDILHPLGHWVGWAFDVPVERDNEGHEFAVTYNITTTGNYFHVDNDPNNYDKSNNWKVQTDSGTYFLYKYYFDEKNDEILNDWLNTIQGEPLKTTQEKLKEVQDCINELRIATLPPAKRVPTAVEYGLNWLRKKQNVNGSWNYEGQEYSMESVGITALAVLAFLNKGVPITDPTVKNGLDYLSTKVRPDGSITLASWEAGRETAAVYETSMSILALVATHDETYKDIINNAVSYLVRWQCVGTTPDGCTYTISNPNYGGWGYPRYNWADLSNTQWVLMALDAASTVEGIIIPASVWENARVFVSRTQNPDGGNSEEAGFTYRPGGGSYGSMTAAGVWSACIIDSHLNIEITSDPLVQKGVAWLLNPAHNFTTPSGIPQNPGAGTSWFYYYLLSAVKALILADAGKDWITSALMYLIKTQVVDETNKMGYWLPVYPQEEREIMSTVEAILTLEAREIPATFSALSYITFILHSAADLHVYNIRTGGHIGVNYTKGVIEVQDIAATFTIGADDSQIISIHTFLYDKYRIELVGTQTGSFELKIDYGVANVSFGTITIQDEIYKGAAYNWMATVTAIAGAFKVYVTRIKLITTMLTIGIPQYIDAQGNIYVTSKTPFSLTMSSDVILTTYRIRNETYSSGWLIYTGPFYLTGLSDGDYYIDYNSTDGRTMEPVHTQKVILDNTPPVTTLSMGEPKYISGITYVTLNTQFLLEATDTGAGVLTTIYRIYNSTYDSGWITYIGPFYLLSLADGAYTIEYYSIDNVQNTETAQAIKVTLFSWNYIFEDTYGRGTILKINLAHKFFQFTAPDKDYGIRKATYMRQCGRAIIIQHCDDELRLIATAVDTKLDFCVAIAWDMQTGKRYFLIDKVGIEV